MSAEVYRKAGELSAQRIPFAVATVVRITGSSSAKPGSKALIGSDGGMIAGWIGGGCAESTVRSEARKCIAVGKAVNITLDMMDEVLGVGMPCGGQMEVFIEPVLPEPELLVIGHGRIAESLTEFGDLMGFSVTVDDPTATREKFPHAERLVTKDMDFGACKVTAATYVVIATQHKDDQLWLQKALEGGAAYIALIASKKRAKLVFDYVLGAGVPPEKLKRVSAPAGLDLGAVTPEEIALSIMSEIVALRRGGDGRPLSQQVMKESSGIVASGVAVGF